MAQVTIMVVPHSRGRVFKVNISAVSLLVLLFLSCVGAVYLVSLSIRTMDYYAMKNRLSRFSKEFNELRSTVVSLKETDRELSRLLSFKSKNSILESAPMRDTGSLDIDLLKRQVRETIESVAAVKSFMAEQRDLYLATPLGWPVTGSITSGFGLREHPITGERTNHTGVDIRAAMGSSVRATASGIVSFSGWTNGSGYIVVLEHGHGFSTAYAHSKENLVVAGQRVRKGQDIAFSGSSGASTGPHVHYEVWKEGKQVDPSPYLEEKP